MANSSIREKGNMQPGDEVVNVHENIQIDDIDDPLLARFMKNAKALQIPDDGIREYIEKCYERYERQMSREQSEKDHDYRMAIEETKQRSIQLDIEKVKAQTMNVDSANDGLKNQGLFRDKLPHMKNFDEKTHKIEDYLHRFEHTAERCSWKKEDWAYKLSCYLDDNALSLYYDFTKENQKVPWDTFKAELLKHFRCTSEGFRKKFRDLKPEQNESLNKYKSTLMRYFNRWLELSNLSDTKDDIINLFLGEQFLEICSSEIASDIRYKKITDFEKMIDMAEDFRIAYPDKPIVKKSVKLNTNTCMSNSCQNILQNEDVERNDNIHVEDANAAMNTHIPLSNHGQSLSGRDFQSNRHDSSQSDRQNRYHQGKEKFRPPYHTDSNDYRTPQNRSYHPRYNDHGHQYNSEQYNNGSSHQSARFQNHGQNINQGNNQIFSSNEKCLLCHGYGHVPSQCLLRNSKNPCSVCGIGGHKRKDCPFVIMSDAGSYSPTGNVSGSTVFSVGTGNLKFESGKVNDNVCSVLRDTGATVCGVRKELILPDQFIPGKVVCKTFGGETQIYEKAKVVVSTPYFSGELVCCVLDDPAADVIIGNIPGLCNVEDESNEMKDFDVGMNRSQNQRKCEKTKNTNKGNSFNLITWFSLTNQNCNYIYTVFILLVVLLFGCSLAFQHPFKLNNSTFLGTANTEMPRVEQSKLNSNEYYRIGIINTLNKQVVIIPFGTLMMKQIHLCDFNFKQVIRDKQLYLRLCHKIMSRDIEINHFLGLESPYYICHTRISKKKPWQVLFFRGKGVMSQIEFSDTSDQNDVQKFIIHTDCSFSLFEITPNLGYRFNLHMQSSTGLDWRELLVHASDRLHSSRTVRENQF